MDLCFSRQPRNGLREAVAYGRDASVTTQSGTPPRDANHGNNSTAVTWFVVRSFSNTPTTDSESPATTNFANRRALRCPVHTRSSTSHSTDKSDIDAFSHFYVCDEFANVAVNKSSVCWWDAVNDHASRKFSRAGLGIPPTSLIALREDHQHVTLHGVDTYASRVYDPGGTSTQCWPLTTD